MIHPQNFSQLQTGVQVRDVSTAYFFAKYSYLVDFRKVEVEPIFQRVNEPSRQLSAPVDLSGFRAGPISHLAQGRLGCSFRRAALLHPQFELDGSYRPSLQRPMKAFYGLPPLVQCAAFCTLGSLLPLAAPGSVGCRQPKADMRFCHLGWM